MKTKLLYTLLLLFSFSLVFAKPISENTAKQVGTNFLKTKTSIAANSSDLTLIFTMSNTSQTPYFYVFNIQNRGFIIIAGDDDVLPVLGYSDQGAFVAENIAPQVMKWLQNYKDQIHYVIENNISATTEIQSEWQGLQQDIKLSRAQQSTHSALSTQGVSPLLQTQWDQNPYVNDLCPYDQEYNERTVTGCPATAMAQIMKYWNYPAQGSGFHSYNHESYGTLSANFGATTYDWASMPNTVSSTNTAVATLMYHCGVAVQMNYGVAATGGSSSYVLVDYSPSPEETCENAFKSFFGYDATTLQGIYRENYSELNWANTLKNELDAGRPIQYAGYGSGGHTWVLDGYDNNNFFHMNWGWGGFQDGYFLLNALSPSPGGTGGGGFVFNDGQQALIGIQPATNTQQNFDLSMYSDLTISQPTYWFGNAMVVTAEIQNTGTETFIGELAAAVFNTQGYFIDFLSAPQTVSLASGYFSISTFTSAGGPPFIPGEYKLAVFYRTEGGSWTIVADEIGVIFDEVNYAEFEVIYASEIETYSDFTVTTNAGMLYQGQLATINVDLINTGGSTFYGDFRVSLSNLDGTLAQSIQSVSENNGLQNGFHYIDGINFSGNITLEPGTYLMELAFKEQGTSIWYYAGSSNFQNPVFVTVQRIPYQPDQYEVNNLYTSAHPFFPSFSGNTTSIITTGSNFHIGTDYDFYRVILPVGYDYSLSARLHDSYDSNDGNTYTVDGIFAYSTDNGNSWSEFYDTVMSNNLSIQNGGEVIFHVAPYFSGNVGTYVLDVDINRQSLGTQDFDVENLIKVYPNPADDHLNIDFSAFTNEVNEIRINNLQGQVISTLKTENKSSIRIALPNLAEGIYFVQLYSTKGISVKKVIINR